MADAASVQRNMEGLMDAQRNLWQQWLDTASPRFGELYAEQLSRAENGIQSALRAQQEWLERARSQAAAPQLPLAAPMNTFWWEAIAANLDLRKQLWQTGFELARSSEQQLREQAMPRIGEPAGLLDAWRDLSRHASERYQEWLQAISHQAEASAPVDAAEQAGEDTRPAARGAAKSNAQRAAKSA